MPRTHKGFSVINEEIAGKSTHDQLTIMRKKAMEKEMEGESDVYCNFYFYANANSFDFIILWTQHRIIIIIVIGTKTLFSVCPSTRQHVANYEWMSGVKAGRHSGTCLVIATLLWQMPHVASPWNGGDKFQCFVLQGVANWVNCAMNGGKLHVQPEVETPRSLDWNKRHWMWLCVLVFHLGIGQ